MSSTPRPPPTRGGFWGCPRCTPVGQQDGPEPAGGPVAAEAPLLLQEGGGAGPPDGLPPQAPAPDGPRQAAPHRCRQDRLLLRDPAGGAPHRGDPPVHR